MLNSKAIPSLLRLGVAAAYFALPLFAGSCSRPLPTLSESSVAGVPIVPLQESRTEVSPAAADHVLAALAAEGLPVEFKANLERGSSTLLVLTAESESALGTWTSLREALAELGWSPVLIGPEDAIEPLQTHVSSADLEPVHQILSKAVGLSISEWSLARKRESPATYRRVPPSILQLLLRPQLPEERVDFEVHRVYGEEGTQLARRVGVILIPTPNSWEAPAYLGFGGWNDCPPPEVLVAFFFRWHQAVGAEVAAVGDDIVEAVLPRAIQDQEIAVEVATEQFYVAPDIVGQGTGDIGRLATGLRRSPLWFFWWD